MSKLSRTVKTDDDELVQWRWIHMSWNAWLRGEWVNNNINAFTTDQVAFGRIILPLSNKQYCRVFKLKKSSRRKLQSSRSTIGSLVEWGGKPSMFGTSNKTNEHLCQFLLFILYTLIPVKFTKWIHLQQQQQPALLQPALLQKKVKILQYNILIQKKVMFTHLERTFM